MRNLRFLQSGFHLKGKRFYCFSFCFFKILFVLRTEDAVISWVGVAGFEFRVVLEGQFFTSEFRVVLDG